MVGGSFTGRHVSVANRAPVGQWSFTGLLVVRSPSTGCLQGVRMLSTVRSVVLTGRSMFVQCLVVSGCSYSFVALAVLIVTLPCGCCMHILSVPGGRDQDL